MKILKLLLAFLAFGTCAKADLILIYNGSQLNVVNRTQTGITHYFLVFDLDTLQYVGIQYGGGPAAGKHFYSVGPTAPFVYAPFATGTKTSQSYFGVGTSGALTSGSTYNFGFYAGNNATLKLGGDLAGSYPPYVLYMDYTRFSNGSTTDDTAGQNTGAFTINLPLTQRCNAISDITLTQAADVVTAALTAAGFGAE